MKRLLTALLLVAATLPTAVLAASPAPPSPSFMILMERLDNDERRLTDWPELLRYRDENTRLATPAPGENRVVFIGDSITDGWGRAPDSDVFFAGKPYVNRGIGGQTTAQMLLRFRADVIALRPRAVVILAGTNDLAGNTGPSSLGMIEDNFLSMIDLAQANGIKVVLASLLPVNDYVDPAQSAHRPPQKIRELNRWLQALTVSRGLVYVDYYTALLDTHGALKKSLSNDGLHPNGAGYALMEPLVERAIEQALAH